MNFSDLKAIQQIADSGLDPYSALVQQAGDRILQQYHGSLMLPLVATLGGVGYCLSVLASPPLAIAVGMLGGTYMLDRVKRGERAFDDIENGRIEQYLSEAQRRVLAQLPSAPENAATPVASTLSQTLDVGSVAVVATITPPPISQHWTDLQWQLWNRLMADCPELRFVLMGKLVVVSGPQQCGKSSLASAIAYLRSYLLGWPTIAVTPHCDGQKIFAGVVVGAGGDFDAIQSFYTNLVDNFQMGGDRQSLVIDELTQYNNGHEELGQSIVRTALSESDKHGIAPILINHARTVSAGFSNIKGMKDLIDNSAVQLTRQYAETDWGEQTRSAQVRMSRPGKGEVVLIVPDWLHLPTLQEQYPLEAIAPIKASPSSATVPVFPAQPTLQAQQREEPNPFQFTSDMVERLYEASPAAEMEEAGDDSGLGAVALDGLSKELQAIASFAHRRNDWIKASDVRGRVRLFRSTQYSPDDIRTYFCQLAEQGLGTVDGEGEMLKYRF
ncbi:hypothetical protein NDI52_28320 [Leptolyngbya sp. PL-A3]|uniref:hypothetical protein n=1 Tax=Leptolyngbya sp. PL-A3 TaxID=2933911 RepID=UPI0032969B51